MFGIGFAPLINARCAPLPSCGTRKTTPSALIAFLVCLAMVLAGVVVLFLSKLWPDSVWIEYVALIMMVGGLVGLFCSCCCISDEGD